MQQIAPYLPQLTPGLRKALMSWHSWRDDPVLPPRFDRMRIGDITSLGLPLSISEARRDPRTGEPCDFLVVYVCPQVRGLALGRNEGTLLSERPHTRPGSPTFAANVAAVTTGKAQFLDASGERGVLRYKTLLGIVLPMLGLTGSVDFAITAVYIEP